MFSTLSKTKIIILSALNLSSTNAFNLDKSKILSFPKELSFFLQCVKMIYMEERVQISVTLCKNKKKPISKF